MLFLNKLINNEVHAPTDKLIVENQEETYVATPLSTQNQMHYFSSFFLF